MYFLPPGGGWHGWMPLSGLMICGRRLATGFMPCMEIAKANGHYGSMINSAFASCGEQAARNCRLPLIKPGSMRSTK